MALLISLPLPVSDKVLCVAMSDDKLRSSHVEHMTLVCHLESELSLIHNMFYLSADTSVC